MNERVVMGMLARGRLPHLIYYGASGTGKTTLAKKVSSRFTTLELNASDDKGIDIVRYRIKEFCETATIDKFKYIVLDEVDAMTSDAQMALLRMMEQYTFNCRFCLICNYLSPLIAPLLSRCVILHFYPLPAAHIRSLFHLPDDTVTHICDFDMRKISQYVALRNVSEDDLYIHNNKVPPHIIRDIIDVVATRKVCDGIEHIEREYGTRNYNVRHMYEYLVKHMRYVPHIDTLFRYYTIDAHNLRFFVLCLYTIKLEHEREVVS